MHAKMNSTSQWIEAHMGALAVLLVVAAVCGGVLVNLPKGVAHSVVGMTAPGMAASVTSAEHERGLARLLELNTAYVPTYGPAASDPVMTNERYLARLRDLNMLAAPASERASAADMAAHERSLARLLELNTVYVPTYGPDAEDLARNERLAGRERELIKIGVSLVDAGFLPVDAGLLPMHRPGQLSGPY